jgi:hypothetical protein
MGEMRNEEFGMRSVECGVGSAGQEIREQVTGIREQEKKGLRNPEPKVE